MPWIKIDENLYVNNQAPFYLENKSGNWFIVDGRDKSKFIPFSDIFDNPVFPIDFSTTDLIVKSLESLGNVKGLHFRGDQSNDPLTPSFSSQGDSDTGFYHISSGKFGFSSNGIKTGEITELGFLNETLGTDFRNLLQIQQLDTGAYATGTGITPADDTIPQITEGTQYLSVSITPKATNSKLIVETNVNFYVASSGTRVCTALHLIGQNDSLGCSFTQIPTDGIGITVYVKAEISNTNLTSKTFTTKIGCPTAINVRFNGIGTGTRIYGGNLKSFIRVSEYV